MSFEEEAMGIVKQLKQILDNARGRPQTPCAIDRLNAEMCYMLKQCEVGLNIVVEMSMEDPSQLNLVPRDVESYFMLLGIIRMMQMVESNAPETKDDGYYCGWRRGGLLVGKPE